MTEDVQRQITQLVGRVRALQLAVEQAVSSATTSLEAVDALQRRIDALDAEIRDEMAVLVERIRVLEAKP